MVAVVVTTELTITEIGRKKVKRKKEKENPKKYFEV